MLVHVTASFTILRVRVTLFPASVFRSVTLVLHIYIYIYIYQQQQPEQLQIQSRPHISHLFFPVGSFHPFSTVQKKSEPQKFSAQKNHVLPSKTTGRNGARFTKKNPAQLVADFFRRNGKSCESLSSWCLPWTTSILVRLEGPAVNDWLIGWVWRLAPGRNISKCWKGR